MSELDRSSTDVNKRLGEHLRRLRKQKGLALLDVQTLSDGEFKASVVGAYERGERAISAVRLVKLAALYRLPLQAMLPTDDGASAPGSLPSTGLALDVGRLDEAQSVEAAAVARFVRRLQAMRQEWAGRVVRIRAEDVIALACAVDRSTTEFIKSLEDEGVRAF